MPLVTRIAWLPLLLVGACAGQDPELRLCGPIAREHFYDGERISTARTLEQFSSYDVETQYIIFVCATQYMHPPLLDFTGPFAAGGNVTAEFLKDELRQGQDGRSTMHILEVYVEAERQGTYRASEDVGLLRLLRDTVDSQEDSPWHDRSERLLEELEQGAN
jgi:hypothetical protein